MDESYEAFVAAELGSLLQLGSRLTGSRDDAWDLVQDTLVRIARAWEGVERGPDGDPGAYARTALVRLHLNRVRSLRREVALGRRWFQAGDSAREGTDPADTFAPPPWMTEALAALSVQQRTAVVLRHGYALSVREVAAAMGCAEGTVKTHLGRGMRALRACAAHDQQDTEHDEQRA